QWWFGAHRNMRPQSVSTTGNLHRKQRLLFIARRKSHLIGLPTTELRNCQFRTRISFTPRRNTFMLAAESNPPCEGFFERGERPQFPTTHPTAPPKISLRQRVSIA